jgi:hypothetical protein
MYKSYLPSFVSFSVIIVAIYSVQPYTTFLIGNTTFWWIIGGAILLAFEMARRQIVEEGNGKDMIFVYLYLFWNIFNIIRGGFIAESYWDWKGLIAVAMALLLPITAFAATDVLILQNILRVYVWGALPLFPLLAFVIATDAYGLYLVPISFLMLFFPVMTVRWKCILAAITLLVLFIDLGARSNVIKFAVPIMLMTVYYIRFFLNILPLETLRKIFFILPILLFSLAVGGIFNVFKMDDYISGEFVTSKDEEEQSLKADTRTLLYEEVLKTAQKYDSWWIGRSPARGNETEAFASLSEISGREERLGNEVAILNIFTWTGIVGVVLYFLIFYKASYIALNDSNNVFSKIIGIFIAFRWLYAWIEDINGFTLTNFFLWFMIGLSFSPTFRRMSNRGVKYWVLGIFYKKHFQFVQHVLSLRKQK